jgi:hypothetical protein
MTSPALLSVILIASNFASNIAKSLLGVPQTDIAKFLLMIWQSNVAKFMFCNLATSLLLSSNFRILSFIWIRGSKHSFLTSFSNFYGYFLFLVFLRRHYLLASSHLSWLHGTPISFPVFIPFVLLIPRHTCAPMFLAHLTRFLKVRRSWEPGTSVSTGILSPFRLFPKVSHANVHWAIANHTFSLNPRTNIFLHDISLC